MCDLVHRFQHNQQTNGVDSIPPLIYLGVDSFNSLQTYEPYRTPSTHWVRPFDRNEVS